jgi:hypothetical protein
VAHRGTGAGVTGGDLDVAEVDARVGHGGDEGVAERGRVCPGGLDAGGVGTLAQPTGREEGVEAGSAGIIMS